MRHEVVHNAHVVRTLETKGARFVDELAQIPPGAPTIFSALGVPKCVIAEAKPRGLPVIDATCPLVTKVYDQARRYEAQGRQLILIGHAGHAEVVGTMGQSNGPSLLVSSEEDVERLDLPPETPVAYVTLTTLSVDDTRCVIAALRRIGPVQTSVIAGPVENAAFRLPRELVSG